MESLKHEFLSFIAAERALSENTRIAYARDLDEFALFLTRKKIGIREVKLDCLRDFLSSLRMNGNQERSLARKCSTLKQFFHFLLREEVLRDDPSELLSVRVRTRRLPKSLSEAEVSRLIEGAGGMESEEDTRDRALLELWYATGMRVSELILLKGGSIDWKDSTVRVFGKGSKERLLPVSAEALKWCLKYRDIRMEWIRRNAPKDPKSFFITIRARAFTRQGVAILLKKCAVRTGLSRRVWPHLMRHTFATHVLGGGADLRVVQELLGHQSITTTDIYTHLDIENLKVMQIKYHPRR